jgi:hypothetical protein
MRMNAPLTIGSCNVASLKITVSSEEFGLSAAVASIWLVSATHTTQRLL